MKNRRGRNILLLFVVVVDELGMPNWKAPLLVLGLPLLSRLKGNGIYGIFV
jgi:hypothetical protein